MAKDAEKYTAQSVKDSIEAAGKINVSEALSEAAQKQKRNLVAWAGVALLVKYYNIHLTKIPWIDAQIPHGASDAAVMIVALPLAYSFFGFLVYAVGDIIRWRFDHKRNFFGPAWDIHFRLTENIWAVRTQTAPNYGQATTNPEQRSKVIEDALESAAFGIEGMRSLQKQGERLTRWKAFTVYVWECAVPLLLGVVALCFAIPPVVKELARLARR